MPLANFLAAPISGSGCQVFVSMLDPTQPNSEDIILGSMFWQSFVGRINYNFTTNATNLIFQLNQNGNMFYLNGTNITDVALAEPVQYNIAIIDGEWPGLIPLMQIQNIEGNQLAYFAISPVASVSTSFAQNCIYTFFNGSTVNCSDAPIFAD